VADTDAALIARVIADDDRSAFELLVRRHQSQLRSFLRRIVRDDNERADDLAQETFIKMHRSIHTYKGTAKFSTWLYRIAYNTFLNDERRRQPESGFDEAYHAPTADGAERASKMFDVDRALRHLSIRQQAIFDLHYKKGMTHDEVATAMELPLGTVKSDLTRCRAKLKEILVDWERD
jgi:RNA polymerase sigma factor (sigma-70 family)